MSRITCGAPCNEWTISHQSVIDASVHQSINQSSINGCISASVGNQLAPVPHKGQSATASNSNQLLGNQQQQAIRTATRTASTYCSWAIVSSEHVRLENKRERVHKRPQASMSTSKARPRAKRVHEHSASTSTARPRPQRVHVHRPAHPGDAEDGAIGGPELRLSALCAARVVWCQAKLREFVELFQISRPFRA